MNTVTAIYDDCIATLVGCHRGLAALQLFLVFTVLVRIKQKWIE